MIDYKRIPLAFMTCLLAGWSSYAQVKNDRIIAPVNKASLDSIANRQTTEAKKFVVDYKKTQLEKIEQPKFKSFKEQKKESSLQKKWTVPSAQIDSAKAKELANSWRDQKWEMKSDGSGTTMPPINVGSLSEIMKVVKTSDGGLSGTEIPSSLSDLKEGELKGVDINGLKPDVGQLKDKASNLNDPATEKMADRNEKVSSVVGKVEEKMKGINEGNLKKKLVDEMANAKKIYSEKQLGNLRDSLGGPKFDSLFNVASAFAKRDVSESDLLDAFGERIPENSPLNNFDSKNQTLKHGDVPSMDAIKEQGLSDLSKVKLPQEELVELSPLAGKAIDSKYMKVIDSMRSINLKKEKLTLEENKVTDKLKSTVVAEKPKFLDKVFLDGIVGYYKDGDITLWQFSPSLAYKFTQFLSAGAGPSIIVKAEDKHWSTTFGFRSFVRGEFWKGKTYVQLEDDVKPEKIDSERTFKNPHSILFGGGVVLPVSKSISINAAALYRLNNNSTTAEPAPSPWVFRLGISTFKLK